MDINKIEKSFYSYPGQINKKKIKKNDKKKNDDELKIDESQFEPNKEDKYEPHKKRDQVK